MTNIDIIKISENERIPMYQQIILSIHEGIQSEKLVKGDKLPSINIVSEKFDISRDTVIMAYETLKEKGVLSAHRGKGFFIAVNSTDIHHKVFLLFDELNDYKETLYNSFINSLGKDDVVDLFFHNFNRRVFDKLIEENCNKYSKYVIMPAKFEHTAEIINKLDKNKLVILDQIKEDLTAYPAIYQNFEKDVFTALMSGEKLLRKYDKLIVIHPREEEAKGKISGFKSFCKMYGFQNEIVKDIKDRELRKGEVYIAIFDRHLAELIKKINKQHLKLGRDIGIISYNDTPIKEVLEGGITTISTDFKKMGQMLAKQLYSDKKLQIENPAELIVRNSL